MRHYSLTSDFPDLPQSAFRKSLWHSRPATLEGGKGGSAPAAPDPFATASATTQTNNDTAAYNKALNANNYINPFGSQSQYQIGFDQKTNAPIYQTSINTNSQLGNAINSYLGQAGGNADQLQQLANYSSQNGSQAAAIGRNFQNLSDTALNISPHYDDIYTGLSGVNNGYQSLMGSVGGLQNAYGSLNNQYAALGSQLDQGAAKAAQQQGQNAAYKAQTQYLDPQFSQQGESLSAQLANQGLTPGSEAYNNAMTNFNNTKQQAYSNAQNQAIMTGSQIGAQNLQNQIAGINTQSGLLGAQGQNIGNMAGLFGQQAGLLGNQASIYGQQGNVLNNQAGLLGLAGQMQSGQLGALGADQNSIAQRAGLYGQGLSSLGNLASLVPGYTGSATSSANPADIGSYVNNQYQGQLANHNADVSSSNATMGTIGTIGAGIAIAF